MDTSNIQEEEGRLLTHATTILEAKAILKDGVKLKQVTLQSKTSVLQCKYYLPSSILPSHHIILHNRYTTLLLFIESLEI